MAILRKNRLRLSLIMPLALAACDIAGENETLTQAAAQEATDRSALTVYKSLSCMCCGQWMAHVEHAAFATVSRPVGRMSAVKRQFGIEPRYRSCHTAISESGYVFEGHIPARLIQRFLADPPDDAIGLAVPGMPLGSPGMESGDRFMPYDVLLLEKGGTSRVYASVTSPDQQYSTERQR
ncbi:hypothetical protein PC39_10322 [Salinisphaera sp. PC39]|uniref:DUF411 domain-containing protein n=1 Tax=Salinisphaera sp. PC39 TaxID=1304156 RepID=UPI0033428C1E